jgi:hypothetical protein
MHAQSSSKMHAAATLRSSIAAEENRSEASAPKSSSSTCREPLGPFTPTMTQPLDFFARNHDLPTGPPAAPRPRQRTA